MTNFHRLEGLVAATLTPLNDDGSLRLKSVDGIVAHLIRAGVAGLYVCGSTGEGVSLSDDERRGVAEAYVKAADGRLPVVIQVGHNSLASARGLAAHARQIGADAVSAACPSYFPIDSLDTLIDCMAEVAAEAAELPFYYYHIPILTGARLDMVEFLSQAAELIPNLAGLKYTAPLLHEFQQCVELEKSRFDVVWGHDEMLLGALATGAKGAVGSTYNVAAPLYRQLLRAFNQGDLLEARRLQSLAIKMLRIMSAYPLHAALKEALAMFGIQCGPCRLPLRSLSPSQSAQLRRDLESLGILRWGDKTDGAAVRLDAPAAATPAPVAGVSSPRIRTS